jgi:hypothetical protein
MPWPFLYCFGYLSLGRLAKVFYKFDGCFFSDVVLRKNGHISCITPKNGLPWDSFASVFASHRILSSHDSINIGINVKGGLYFRVTLHHEMLGGCRRSIEFFALAVRILKIRARSEAEVHALGRFGQCFGMRPFARFAIDLSGI